MAKRVVNMKNTLTRILRDLEVEFLTTHDLAKEYGLKQMWIKNKLNANTFGAKRIEHFTYRNTIFYNKIAFEKWYKRAYKKELGVSND